MQKDCILVFCIAGQVGNALSVSGELVLALSAPVFFCFFFVFAELPLALPLMMGCFHPSANSPLPDRVLLWASGLVALCTIADNSAHARRQTLQPPQRLAGTLRKALRDDGRPGLRCIRPQVPGCLTPGRHSSPVSKTLAARDWMASPARYLAMLGAASGVLGLSTAKPQTAQGPCPPAARLHQELERPGSGLGLNFQLASVDHSHPPENPWCPPGGCQSKMASYLVHPASFRFP